MRKRSHYSMSIYQKKYKCEQNTREIEEVDITSLLDILVILLVFLLKSYNASSLKVDLVKDLSLVNSFSRDLGQFAPVLQVTSTKDLYIDNKLIGNISENTLERNVASEFKVIREKEKKLANNKPNPNINIVLDGDLPYSEIENVMNMVSKHQYENFKFIVKGNYN